MKAVFKIGLMALTTFALIAPVDAQCPPSRKRSSSSNGKGSNPGAPTSPSPSGPTTPSPSGPSTPGPNTPSSPGPTTPRGQGPHTPRGGPNGPRTPRGGPAGIPIEFTRQSTSKEILDLDWDFPVHKPFKKPGDGKTTSAAEAVVALPAVDAYAVIAGNDQRPLLVLRECDLCKGSDAALLRRSMGDEKTKLLARWFHCVKLPPDVLRDNHPFRNLFPEEKPPHLFFARHDGSGRVTMTGDQKQTDLQKAMMKTLEDNYKKSPKPALKVMITLLSEFDSLDILEQDYKKMLRQELYKNGGKSSRTKKLKADIAEVEKKKASAMRRAKAVCDLKLIVQK